VQHLSLAWFNLGQISVASTVWPGVITPLRRRVPKDAPVKLARTGHYAREAAHEKE
jgi:hypothetical protein